MTLTKVASGAQLTNVANFAAGPGNPFDWQARSRGDKRAWLCVVNLSPLVFEVQDMTGQTLLDVVMPYSRAVIPLDVRQDVVYLNATTPITANAGVPAGQQALYIGLSEFEPGRTAALLPS